MLKGPCLSRVALLAGTEKPDGQYLYTESDRKQIIMSNYIITGIDPFTISRCKIGFSGQIKPDSRLSKCDTF